MHQPYAYSNIFIPWETEYMTALATYHYIEEHSHSIAHQPCRLILFYWVLVVRKSNHYYRCKSLLSQRKCSFHFQEYEAVQHS